MPTQSRKLPRLPVFLAALAVAVIPAFGRAADLPKYLPNATEAVVSVNMKQLLEAPLVKDNFDNIKLLSRAFAGDAIKAVEDLGIDPFTDVERVTMALPGGQQPENGVVFVQGKFDADKIKSKAETMAKEHKDVLQKVEKGGYSCWELTPPGTDRKIYIAQIDDKTLAASHTHDFVVDALAKQAGKKAHEMNRELAGLLEKAKFDQSISFVGLPGQLANLGQGGEVFGRLQNVVGGITLTDEVKLEVGLNARNQDEAKIVQQQIKDALNLVKGILQTQVGKKPELKSAVEALEQFKVDQAGNTVTLRGQITKELIEKLKP
jgi:hypothetical protein